MKWCKVNILRSCFIHDYDGVWPDFHELSAADKDWLDDWCQTLKYEKRATACGSTLRDFYDWLVEDV